MHLKPNKYSDHSSIETRSESQIHTLQKKCLKACYAMMSFSASIITLTLTHYDQSQVNMHEDQSARQNPRGKGLRLERDVRVVGE